ncbi:MAG TPA: anthranilate synthase component I family protein, partial [Gemmatimonadaceae bacterium]|nr:anthranilate synthase component I family protein [Gemmatimonadaceae bacterium]
SPPPRGVDAPDALFVFSRSILILDNLKGLGRIVVAVPVPAGTADVEMQALFDQATDEIEVLSERLRAPSPLKPLALADTARPAVGRSTYARDRFLKDVERIREYIMAGDCFQALLARRIELPHDFESADLYRALRALNPSPYMYHLQLDGMELVGSSPELLVRVANGKVTVRPIAGTRPRGATPADDERLSAELLADEKERAEHIMLVDLGRNDVGRIARYGSVKVTDFMTVERYSHVLHIVSQVEGDLRDGCSALDAYRATFPAGTMTGAPKVRAMQIIDELEPERRGAYAGAVGYIATGDERMDLAITIRTCVIAGGKASIQVGAGIVADSVPEREWDETENKARALLTALGRIGTSRR